MNLMNNEKHYNTLNNYYKQKYHKKIAKISLNAGFTCPNIDGKKGYGGCIYCSNGSGEFAGDKNKSLKEQFNQIKAIMHQKWDDCHYIVYFQSNTNTYAPINVIKEKFDEAIALDENIKEISIATRCDSISDECLDYLSELNKKKPVQIELGLQTTNEKTAKFINRGHSLEEFDTMVKKLQKRNLSVVVHIINGLPYETKEDMINTIKHVNDLKIKGVKIHMLYVCQNTKLGQMYLENPFHILSLEEYVEITANQLQYLDKDVIIHRITGDANKETLIEPKWGLKKFIVINEIDKYMRKNNIYQGDYAK